jgi:hypothetical protein
VPRVVPKKHPFTAEDVVEAWQSFAWDSPSGRPFTIVKGTRLRGDHEVVVGAPWYFVRADAPSEEVPNVWDHVPEPPQHEPEFHRPAPPVPDEDAVVYVMAFQVLATGVKVVRGQRLHRNDPLVLANPAAFAVVRPLTKGSASTR